MVLPALRRASSGCRRDRAFRPSWYNRAGVEKVMGFATQEQVQAFLKAAPKFERQLVDDGILLFKIGSAATRRSRRSGSSSGSTMS